VRPSPKKIETYNFMGCPPYPPILAMNNSLAGDGTCHDAEGPFMTSGGQLMTEKDISKKAKGETLNL